MPHFHKEFRKPSALARAPFLLAAGSATGLFAAGLSQHVSQLDATSVAHAANAAGNPLPILTDLGFWQSLPTLPDSLASFPDLLGATGLAVLFSLTAWSFLRILARRSWTAVGAYSLALCCIPFIACTMFCSGLLPVVVVKLGASLGLTVTTLALGSIAAVMFAVFDLVRPTLPVKVRQRIRRPRKPFAITRSVPDVVTLHVTPFRRRKTG